VIFALERGAVSRRFRTRPFFNEKPRKREKVEVAEYE